MGSDDEDDEKSSNASGSDEDDEDKSGSDEDGSGSDDNDDSDEDDGSGSGSGSDEDDDDDDSDDKEEGSSDEDSKKDGKEKVIPNDLQKPEENELKKLTLEIGSIQSEIDNFLCTLSVDTQNRIGFDPMQAQMNNISNRQNYSYLQNTSPLNRNNYTQNIPANNPNNNNFRPQFNQTNLPSRSHYNTYGQYRFQAESQQPVNQDLRNSGGFMKEGRKGSMEDVAEIQAMLGKQQQQQQQQHNEDEKIPKERFQLPKESQSIIDNYYQNLYRKKEPSARNYSNVDDLYKQRQKTVYDEDEIRKKPINNNQKYLRNSGMQAAIPKLGQNQQKIDEAIRILLGKR